ncbi:MULTISPECIES: type-F conjugative transfer system protein TrbI [Sphingobium]|uniref:Uncharacterized protein n=2 Tax=Sphingobium TaxID=165695 RepID=A0A0M3AH43_9SPHN|nr:MULTISPECIES: type-F conjugative transfer system protein TrbI [Sphingobium]OAP30380.1 hypothetical protein A8O16_18805 [Sphingobium sp. 20006FA]KKW89348.1 hypothetical protein YP76_25840 [Sphingobium chungbukense]KXU30831.1 hypothetical protein AXW74_15730 [Sphingobium sp. AM]KYC30658.1 hypothetical protein A0J57_19500 [Sphingobium sp. 22B]MCB4858993.1 type-F conjugative transfer system protein TrbI [Sphingobium sp. PNB]
MAEQQELDLPAPDPVLRPRRTSLFAGFTRGQLLGGAALAAALVWGMWVTKTLLAPPAERIVSARLSTIVGEYVQAQAHSASSPAQVEAEMRRFMGTLDQELQRRSRQGEIVMVGEAVLSKNVPDITESIKKAVYASGIAMPKQASAQQLLSLQRETGGLEGPMPTPQSQASAPSPMPAMPSPAGASSPFAPVPLAGEYPGGMGASVSSFGGHDGAGGQ